MSSKEKLLKGGIWHLYWASARKDPTLADLLHEKECYYKLHFPFLPSKQHTAKAYDELEIPHLCGVVDRSRLHKMYLEMRKSEVPVIDNRWKVVRSKSLPKSPCISIKKKSIPKTLNESPSKVKVNERPLSSKPPLPETGKTLNFLRPPKSVTFQDGALVIDISPNRIKNSYPLNVLTPNVGSPRVRRDLKNVSQTLNMYKFSGEPLSSESKVGNQNTLDNKEKPLFEENSHCVPSNNKPSLSESNKCVEINPRLISNPPFFNDNSTKTSMLLPTTHVFLGSEIQKEGEECSSDNQENTSSRLDQNTMKVSNKSYKQNVSFLHNFPVESSGEKESLEGNDECQLIELVKSGNQSLQDKITTRKKPECKIKQRIKSIPRSKGTKKPLTSKKSANSSSAVVHSNAIKEKENDDKKNLFKGSVTDKFIRRSRRILSEKSKESKFSFNGEDILHTTDKSSSSLSFNDLNINESFEEKFLAQSLESNTCNESICGLSLSINEHNYDINSEQYKEKMAYASIFALSGEDKRDDQFPQDLSNASLTPINLNLSTLMDSPVLSPLNISLCNTPVSSPNGKQSKLISDGQPAFVNVDVLLPTHRSRSPDKVYSDNQALFQTQLSDDSYSFLKEEQSLLDLETILLQRARIAVLSEMIPKESLNVCDALSCESQAAPLANEISKISETPSSSEELLKKNSNSKNNNLNYLRESRIMCYRDTDESSLELHQYSDDSFHDNQPEMDSLMKDYSENLSFLNKATEHLTINDNDLPPSKEETLKILDEKYLYEKENNLIEPKLVKDNNLGTRSSVASVSISLENSTSGRNNLEMYDLANISERKQEYVEDIMIENICDDVDRTSLENYSSSESLIFSPSDKEVILANRKSLEEVSTAYETNKGTGKLKINMYTRKDLRPRQIQYQNKHKSTSEDNMSSQTVPIREQRKSTNNKSINVSPVTGFEQLNKSSYINWFKSSVANVGEGNINEFNNVEDNSTNLDCGEDKVDTFVQKLLNKISPVKEHSFSNLSGAENYQMYDKNPHKCESSILIGCTEVPCKRQGLRSSVSEQIHLGLFEEINNLGKRVKINQNKITQDKESVSCETNIEDVVSTERLDFKNHEKPTNITPEKNLSDYSNEESGVSKHSFNMNSVPLMCTNAVLNSNNCLNLSDKNKIPFNSFENDGNAKSESIISNSFSEGTKKSGKPREINLNWTLRHASIAPEVQNLVEIKTSKNFKDQNCRSESSVDFNKQKNSVSITEDDNSPTNYKSSPVLDKLLKLKEISMSRQGENIANKCNEIKKNLKSTEIQNISQDKKKYSNIVKSNILDCSQLSMSFESKNEMNETMSMFKYTEIETHYMQEETSKSLVHEETGIKEVKSKDMLENMSPINNSKRSPVILSSEVISHKKRKNHFIRKQRAKLLKSHSVTLHEISSSSEEERRPNKKPPKTLSRCSARLNFQNGLISSNSEGETPQIEKLEISEKKGSIIQDNLPESEKFSQIEKFLSIKQSIEDLQKSVLADIPQNLEVSLETLAANRKANLDNCKKSEKVLLDISNKQNRLKYIKNKSRILASDIFSSEENRNTPQTLIAFEGCEIQHGNNSEDEATNAYKTYEGQSRNGYWGKSTSMKEALQYEKWYRSQWRGESNSTKPNINHEYPAVSPLTGDTNKSNELLKKKMCDASFHSSTKVYQSDQESENYLSKYFQPEYEDTQCHKTSKESNPVLENCHEVSQTKRQALSEIRNSQDVFIVKKSKLNDNKRTAMDEHTTLHFVRQSSENSFKKSHIVLRNMNSPTLNESTNYEKNETVSAKWQSEVDKYNEKKLKSSPPKKIITSQYLERSVRKRGSSSPPANKPEATEYSHGLEKEDTLQVEETYRPESKKYMKSSIVRFDLSACESAQSSDSLIETLLRRTFFMGN